MRDILRPDIPQLGLGERRARLAHGGRGDGFVGIGVFGPLQDEHGSGERPIPAVGADVAVPCRGRGGVPPRPEHVVVRVGEELGAGEAAAFDRVQQFPAGDALVCEPVGEGEVGEDGGEALGDAGDAGVVLEHLECCQLFADVGGRVRG